MTETRDADTFDLIVDAPFDTALSDRYLVYAMSTITARSLPDLRDGLKPVHRRLLWAMRLLKLDPGQAYKKCARVVGDTIGMVVMRYIDDPKAAGSYGNGVKEGSKRHAVETKMRLKLSK